MSLIVSDMSLLGGTPTNWCLLVSDRSLIGL
jgi:hypothetical protein